MSAFVRLPMTEGLDHLVGSNQDVAPRPWQFVTLAWRRTP
jgi:hypothetical protein